MTYQPTVEQLELESAIDTLAQTYYKKYQEAMTNMLVALSLKDINREKYWQEIANICMQVHKDIKHLLER